MSGGACVTSLERRPADLERLDFHRCRLSSFPGVCGTGTQCEGPGTYQNDLARNHSSPLREEKWWAVHGYAVGLAS